MKTKKIRLAVTVVAVAVTLILLCLAAAWVILEARPAEAPREELAVTFLTEMYQVKDHTRFDKWNDGLKKSRDFSKAFREEAYNASYDGYKELYDPLTTGKGYRRISATSDYIRADLFAAEYSYLLEVESVDLREEAADETTAEYSYTVVIRAISDNGEQDGTVTADGRLTLQKDPDGVFRVDHYNPNDRNVYKTWLGVE